jgi:hypothetical protein
MTRGQLIRLRSFTDECGGGTRMGWRADKGKVFVCVVLGTEPTNPKDGEELDIEAVMKAMGWVKESRD